MHRKKIDIPLIGLGTWELLGKECTDTIKRALDIGYRHIDTAHYYNNHKAIGKVVKEADRATLFLTSKFNVEQINDRNIEKSVKNSCEEALKDLRTDYLDLYLLHWPDHSRPYKEMVASMQPLLTEGKIRFFGVSNCTIHHLEELLEQNIHADVNQVEFHPHLYQKELWQFCQRHGIQLEAYRPLGKGALIKEPLFKEIGNNHNKTAAQVLLRWSVQKRIAVISKARSEKHLSDNLHIFDFVLREKEMHTLDHLSQEERYCFPEWEEFNY